MNLKIANILSKVIEGGIIVLLFLTPLFFLTQTSENFSFPKQTLLVFGIGVLTILWGIKMVFEGKVLILQNSFVLPIIVFLGAFLVSTFLSINRFSSVFGPHPSFYGGLFTLVIFILSFFLITNNIKTKNQISRLIFTLCFSGLILALIGILHFFNIFPAKNIIGNSFVTPAGSADTTSIFLALLLPFLLFPLFFKKGIILQILSVLAAVFLLLYIFFIGNLAALLSVFLVVIAALLFSFLSLERTGIFKISFVLFFCLALLAINNFGPIRNNIPFLKDKAISHEVSLKSWTAWLITADGFRDPKTLVLGSGPGTYLTDFTRFKPIGFNYQPFWNLRLDRSFNEYFQLISTIGILGFAAFLFLLLRVFSLAKEFLKRADKKEEITGMSILSAIFLFAFICLLSVPVAIIYFMFWVLLGLLASYLHSSGLPGAREVELSLSAIQPKQEKKDQKREIFPFLVLIFILIISGVLMWQISKVVQAEMKFVKGLSEGSKPEVSLDATLQPLNEAIVIMPQNDAYYRVLSSAILDLMILGEQQQQEIPTNQKEQLLATAIRAGEQAVRLNNQNIFNWENLQRVYTLIPTEESTRQLIERVFPAFSGLDPLNPRHANDLGLVYFNMQNDIENAKMNFKVATNLKPDYIEAHYNLARVFRAGGNRENALLEYDSTLNLIAIQISLGDRNTLGVPSEQLKQLEVQIRAERELVSQEIEKTKQAVEEQKKIEEEKKPEEEKKEGQ